jgi:hypothetical protein
MKKRWIFSFFNFAPVGILLDLESYMFSFFITHIVLVLFSKLHNYSIMGIKEAAAPLISNILILNHNDGAKLLIYVWFDVL